MAARWRVMRCMGFDKTFRGGEPWKTIMITHSHRATMWAMAIRRGSGTSHNVRCSPADKTRILALVAAGCILTAFLLARSCLLPRRRQHNVLKLGFDAMNRSFALFAGAALFAAALPAMALDTSVPSAGLPSAADFSAQVLPELSGVVSWKTLSQV